MTTAVSVLLPVYNAERTLRQTIDSILNQDLSEFELVIIDDGSKDQSHEIISDYAKRDSRVRPHLNHENLGLITRLNQGLELCQNELVARMDSDDECLSHRLQTQVRFMDKHPDVAVCGSWAFHMGATPAQDRLVRLPYTRKEIERTLPQHNCLYHPTVMLRRSLILGVGGYSGRFPHAEDYELWLRVSREHAIVNIPEPLLRYRLSQSGVTFNKRWDLLYSFYLAQERHLQPHQPWEAIQQRAAARLNETDRVQFFTNVLSSAVEDFVALEQFEDGLGLVEKCSAEVPAEIADKLRAYIAAEQEICTTAKKGNAKWSEGVDFEVAFWDRWFATKGAEWPADFQKRLDPTLPLQPQIAPFVEAVPSKQVKVLDVGSGPMTWLGKTHPSKELHITATDALAPQYDQLLAKYKIVPPVRTIAVPAEKLSVHFALNSFDFVYARNSIDHCDNPFHAVCEMLAVAKPGCWVCLQHAENEAEHENYSGFHQWNFSLEDGDFIIAGKGGRINVNKVLKAFGTVESSCTKRLITTRIAKSREVFPEDLAALKAIPFERFTLRR